MLTACQKEGSKSIHKWYKSSMKQIFVLAGYAGTGKSFLTRYALNELNLKVSEIAYCTFTGKASLVLMRYHGGNSNISTVHSLVYDVVVDSSGTAMFELKKCLPGIKLIVIDEASMINFELLNDLKSFNIPILAIGDHGQLPAIGNPGNLMLNPDFVLTEIMRQAQDNPIIYLSMLAREGKYIAPGKYGKNAVVLSKSDPLVNSNLMLRANQVICGYNNTRNLLNQQIRNTKGLTNELPEFGDKVIFTANNWSKNIDNFNLVNGMVGYIVNEPEFFYHQQAKIDVVKVSVQPDFLMGVFHDLYIPIEDFFDNKLELNRLQKKFLDRMTFGYAITCHKSQGSQWPNVFVWNEPFGDDPWRWTYTAITRAEENLILAV